MASGMKGKSENDMISRGRLMRRLLYLRTMQDAEGLSHVPHADPIQSLCWVVGILTGCCALCAWQP